MTDDLRNTHNRATSHFGVMSARLVVMTNTLQEDIVEGDSLQHAIAAIHDRMVYLESGIAFVSEGLTCDAEII